MLLQTSATCAQLKIGQLDDSSKLCIVCRVESQHGLERQLELIDTHEQEVEKALESIEEEADRIYKDERAVILADERAGGDIDMVENASPLDLIVRILNNQLTSLVWIDEKAADLSSRIQSLADSKGFPG